MFAFEPYMTILDLVSSSMRKISIGGVYIVKSILVYAAYACVLLFCFSTIYIQTPGTRSYEIQKLNITFSNFITQYYVHVPPSNICHGVEVIILIPSRPTGMGLDFRNLIRDTWLSKENIPPGYGYRFVVGVPTEKTTSRINRLENMLIDEAKENDDLIIYNLNDTYTDLHLKTYILMQWQQTFCSNAKYLLKADDDTSIDLWRLKVYVDSKFEEKRKLNPTLVLGMALQGYPIRDKANKWYVSEDEYPGNSFPMYCNGAMYLVSSPGVQKILQAAKTTKAIHIEDVLYTGVLAEKAGVIRFGVDSFVSPWTWHVRCFNSTLPHPIGAFALSLNDITSYFKWLREIKCSDRNSTLYPNVFTDPRNPNISFDHGSGRLPTSPRGLSKTT